MQNRIIELASDPVRLRARNRLLEIFSGDQMQASVPISDIAVLIAAQPRVSFTHAVLGQLTSAGGVFVACDSRRQPIGMMLPLDGYHQQARRFRSQAAAGKPLRKRCWQRIVRAKVAGQATVLQAQRGEDFGLAVMARQVKSGDVTNIEAQAARRYWSVLFERSFRRDRAAEDANLLLNYGYGILRAITARAICAAGLHPGLGLHHHHRESGFPLADDLMEPFRPLVDRAVCETASHVNDGQWTSSECRRQLVAKLTGAYRFHDESRTLFDWASRTAASLASCFETSSRRFLVPTF